ncbi:MAG: hypothetical protein QOI47_1394, partial [Actinomycetota bacterium]|nr:hypothetical protein [Actinomycetota bacterium]
VTPTTLAALVVAPLPPTSVPLPPTTVVLPPTTLVPPAAPVAPPATIAIGRPATVAAAAPAVSAPRPPRPTTTTTNTTAPLLAFVDEAAPAPTATTALAPSTVRKTPPTTESKRPRFVLSIPRPGDVSWSIGHVGANASLAFALVLFLGLPAELLNSSLKERFSGRPRRARLPALVRVEEVVNRLPDPLLLIGFGIASAVIYAQLDPSVGFDSTSMLLIGALALALIVVTGVVEAIRIPYLRRRHQVGSHLRMFPKAFVIAAALVLVSRVTGFHPGFIFGVTCGLTVSGRLRDEDEGRSIAMACGGLLVIAAIAWVSWIPAAAAAARDHPSALAILLDTFLATLWVTALQVVLFGLLPMRFLYGEKVMQWSRRGWAVLYASAMFLFVQTLFHPSSGNWGGFSDGTMLVIVVSGVALLLASIAFWFWVRIHPTVAPAPPPPPDELMGELVSAGHPGGG